MVLTNRQNHRCYSSILTCLVLCLVFCTQERASAQVVGDTVNVANTFEDTNITGGVETIFGLSGPTTVIDPGTELSAFVGLYDINLSEDSLEMTLVDNSSAADLILPAGRFDRYYYQIGSHTVISVELDGLAELNEFARVELLNPGFQLDVADVFATGIPVPIDFDNGVFLVEFGPGTNLTNLGVTANVNFTTQSVPEPGSMSIIALLTGAGLLRRRRSIN